MGLDCHHDNIMFLLQSSEHYTNLRESFLELRLQLVKEDGSDVVHRGAMVNNEFPEGPDYGVCPINNIAHSLFSYVELTLNDNMAQKYSIMTTIQCDKELFSKED